MGECQDCKKTLTKLYRVDRLWSDGSGRIFGKPKWVCNNCAKTELEIFPDKIRVSDPIQGIEIKAEDLIWE